MSAARASATLVIGGARSGKSAFAEKLVIESGLERIYVATCASFDEEMQARIARHRDQRGADWKTVEEARDIADVLKREAAAGSAVLVDCLTLWLSNLMFEQADIEAETARLLEALRKTAGPVVLVSNEVGTGIVPENALARRFRDAQGRLNKQIAEVANQVVLVAAGLPLLMKPNHIQPEIRL
ncbi:bifunctional adenosylcobinamide kinase/adenosylcobinamide-phosphate guanylyltransferase [Rhizobiales bacterium]|uniref:bifunctional adenosylcobinamide kinase/adenosylcobinamide-phosphate guanylyltransferase n=1 Tax=Hongsoonwoonella zoysiae TaxID=2821844 RepID=UPI00155FF9EE|nr:bifunctional adenosylcobinamide kinase/adenosylcobinamide-phosphate guanylyltransferase [Hongsoonwoonella zoysiae]NRG19051.1 bifunctional adenosylcobinamide kinase/adenosylcobinamide-phosphate guanylyltransferase [Hongsoonwoonella zoysiae]